ncbi:Uncharacterized conserved protein [Lentzea xinjiangensis]|uniref:Uncharacterized conserved protein n=1 Tax=Lentzea xinjiangensis TaxID=402600 RepID=A0A1H9LV06_9PSEU|nr:YciI family protein [Lentzea xinjiangensis]SER15270.1 Uncharacterized conserved protein [Lentzea xinjiangensis]
MRFVTIGYGGRDGYDRADPAVLDAAHARDRRLREAGAEVGAPVRVRNHGNAGTTVEDGAFLRADLPVAGSAVVGAASLEDAVELVRNTPCAVAHGVVEVWPLG